MIFKNDKYARNSIQLNSIQFIKMSIKFNSVYKNVDKIVE